MSLHKAAEEGDVDKLSRLLREGAEIDEKDSEGMTALHHAAWEGQAEAARLLLREGASVNEKGSLDFHGLGRYCTSLHSATFKGNAEIVGLLLEKGASVNETCSMSDMDGMTALHIAATTGKAEMAEKLLRHGADPGLRTARGKTALELATLVRNNAVVSVLEDPSLWRREIGPASGGGNAGGSNRMSDSEAGRHVRSFY